MTAGPWLQALRHSHERLHATAGPLGADQLRQPSYAAEWSIAQVLSHLGSQAEIFGLLLDAGLTGQEAPGREQFLPIWDSWNARTPQAQAADALRADAAVVARFESLTDDERDRLRLSAFGMQLDVTGLARMRLSEHAIHTWDVVVALDPTATVAPDAVELLAGTLDALAGRAGKPDGKPRRVRVVTSDPARRFLLQTGDTVTLTADDDTGEDGNVAELRLPAEAFVRLCYGRLDPAHTPPVAEDAGLAELRPLFPGF